MLIAIVLGLAATSVMVLVMTVITRLGLANADMIRAIGSMLTGSLSNALWVGTLVHFSVGIIFALLYCSLLATISSTSTSMIPVASTFLGFTHGFIVSFFLIIGVAEHHPIRQFRKVGFQVALAHVVGHIFYGATLGLGYMYLVHGADSLAPIFEPLALWKFIGYVLGGVITLLAILAVLAGEHAWKRKHPPQAR